MPPAARVGDKSKAFVDVHGAPCCPHPGPTGPAIVGSPTVTINQQAAVRMNDTGVHAACCNANTWKAMKGSATVFINGLPAMRKNDLTLHCGGPGQVTDGSPDVSIGG